jgi:hypothetical protein
MSAYVRRFTSDPGEDTLLEIESVNVLDLEPTSSIGGIGSGFALCIGEFENGPFNTITEVTSTSNLESTFGKFGHTYSGAAGQNPCARSRLADSAVAVEYWNGNGSVQLSGKKFKRLAICRVDTSAGSVRISRCASIKGTAAATYSITPATSVSFAINGAAAATATWDAARAVVTGTSGSFATLTGGEFVTLGYDDAANFTVTFLSGDDTIAEVVSRVNAAAGFTFASNATGELRLTGRKYGTAGQVRVVSGSTGTVAKLGLSVASTSGTGDVADAAQVTPAEVKARIEADISGSVCEFLADGTPRVASSTAGTGTIQCTACTATALGFSAGSAIAATTGNAGTIPAGTVVQTSGANQFVTMQDVAVTATSYGPYDVKVRHATDDSAGTTATTGTIVEFPLVVELDAFAVTNVVACTALTEAQIDAAYVTAIAATKDVNTAGKLINVAWSARQSNAVRVAIRQNAIDASSQGCFGRVACIRPPVGTLKANAESASAPGCKAYRTDRVVYCYPAVTTYVPAIAAYGTGGGAGFTSDGIVTVGADGFVASLISQMNPEENIGQMTDLLGGILALEAGAAGLSMTDYIAFKAAGICAPRIDDGVPCVQSGVVNVDPSSYPNLKNLARRRMADYIQDSLATAAKKYSKKLMTARRRIAIASEQRVWLESLLGGNGGTQRIESYEVDEISRNTPASTARGLFYVIHRVRTLASLDSIVVQSEVGESVVITGT